MTAHTNTRPCRILNSRIVQNFHLVWLGANINETNDDCRNSIMKLREVVHTVNTFVNIDECIDFITDIEEQAFVIISEELSQHVISIVQGLFQVRYVYIFCKTNVQNKECSKVTGLYTDITSLCEALQHGTRSCDHDSLSISYIKKTDTATNQNLDILHSSFMYTQILKEILLTIDFEQVHLDEFITYCREQFANNTAEMKNIDKIEKEYRSRQPIWWYTYPCFLYSMLNRALRTMEIDLITKMGFFLRDLHHDIVRLHSKQYSEQTHSDSFTVYRGQGLSKTDFDQLKTTQGGLLAFNNFLSTSKNYDVSLRFAHHTINTSDKVGVLFVMKIDPSITTASFANVKSISYYQKEEEILFSMHSVFRIGQVKQIENNQLLWHVELTLTSDYDPQLQNLTTSMRAELGKRIGWFRLGEFMMKVAQFDKAQQLFQIILDRSIDDMEKMEIYHHLGLIKFDQGNYPEAITYYEKSLKIPREVLPEDHPALTVYHVEIGSVYSRMGEYSIALSYYEKALEIQQKILPANHPSFAAYYSNIGLVYGSIGQYSKALLYYEKALEVFEKTLPENHPDLGASYNNIGLMHKKMNKYSKALSYYEKALRIKERILPENHPDLTTSYNNIGNLYSHNGQYSKALSYYEKAFEIRQRTLPANHPDLGNSYNNMGNIYYVTDEYSKALWYLERALDIWQCSPSSYHPYIEDVKKIIRDINKKLK